MRRWWREILLFSVVYLLALVATLPAAQALHWAEPLLARMAQRPQLAGVSGTLWEGRAAQLSYRGVVLGEVKWDISLWRIVLGRLDVEWELLRDDGHLHGRVRRPLYASEWQVSEVEGQLPGALVTELLPALRVAAAGSFSLAVERVVLAGSRISAIDGRIVWSRAGITAPFALALGDLAADFTTEASGVVGQVRDGGGPLQLEAQLNLNPDGSYTLAGKAQARDGANPALATSLSLLGQADGQGRVPFTLNGRL